MDELKPCPFCGGKATIFSVEYWCMVECTECGARSKNFAAFSTTEAEQQAKKFWNRRVENDKQ